MLLSHTGKAEWGAATHLEHLLSLLQGGFHLGELKLQQAVGVLLPLEFLRTRSRASGGGVTVSRWSGSRPLDLPLPWNE